jgi:peptidoglycan-associated lipoprotein
LLGACARGPRPVARALEPIAVTRTVTRTETRPSPLKAPKDVELASLEVSEAIARVCALPDSSFDFDSSTIDGSVANALDALAACFREGELAGRHLKIVGHADPRGTDEYNLALGQRRASAVANYLVGKGLPEARIETTSVGEYEAKGKDEAGWQRDRRVEILLGDEAVLLPRPAGGAAPGGI